MGKYDPLAAYLARQRTADVVDLSFRDVERLVGGILPKASLNYDWWATAKPPQDAPQKRAWNSAGFNAQVHLRQERVLFSRVHPRATPNAPLAS